MWFFNSPEIVFGEGALGYLSEIEGQRAFIVTDQNMMRLGFVELVAEQLKEAGMKYQTFAEVEPNPTFEMAKRGAAAMSEYGPDWVIGLGGGSCMDAAKAMWVLYERPDMEPAEINPMIPLGLRQKARLITIPTTSGTGAEVTWPVVLTDAEDRRKLVLGSRENMADLAIVDPVFVKALPPQIAADTGMDALAHAIEGYTSSWANDFGDGLCLKAIQLVFDYLPRVVADGEDGGKPRFEAREKMHNASCIAGMAFTNAFLGINHSLAHKLGGEFHIPHGLCNALLMPHVIAYNGEMNPSKFTSFPKYDHFIAPEKYADIARHLGLPARTPEEGVKSLIKAIMDLRNEMKIPQSIQEYGIDEKAYMAKVKELAIKAFGDQCTTANPRLPLISELEEILIKAYYGK